MSVFYNQNNSLMMGDLSLEDLGNQYGTPLFVYDEQSIKNRIKNYHIGFQSGLDLNEDDILSNYYSISYASKAFSNIQMLKLAAKENLDLDVVSLGELYMAEKAGYPTHKIHFHGNNKTEDEISYALNLGIGYFVVDSFDEIERIDRLANTSVDVMIRLNPEVAAQTHQYIQTGQEDSKFGFSLSKGLAEEAINRIQESNHLNFIGIHFHLGSQIKNPTLLQLTAERVLEWSVEKNIALKHLNVGGGFSVKYLEDDEPFQVKEGIHELSSNINKICQMLNIETPIIGIEPGRSIVGDLAVTIYEVGTIKEIPELTPYVSVDGGMSDHIRTALYGAEYTVLPLNKKPDTPNTEMNVVGKLCESGDIIGKNKRLPENLKVKDKLAVLSTGAYHYSMASNYNQMLKPAVVFVDGENHRIVARRQQLDQLLDNEILD